MRISKVKIHSYRSILETEFKIDGNILALAGGNESGKSNILMGINDFFSDKDLSESKHLNSKDEPEITLEFSLSLEEKDQTSSLLNGNTLDVLIISKKGSTKQILNLPTENAAEPEVTNNPEIAPVSQTDATQKILEMLPQVVPVFSVESLITGKDIPIDQIIAAKDATEGPYSTIYNFLELGNVDLERIIDPNISLNAKSAILLKASSQIGKKLRKIWRQEDLKVLLLTDGKNISIFIRDGGCLPDRPVIRQNMSPAEIESADISIDLREDDSNWIWTNPDERSNGFRWFATFYSKFLSKSEGISNRLLIIDDLGVFLNASIQNQLLEQIKSFLNNDSQLIYATHSPYMINFTDYRNIYLVEKKVNGTNVIENWLAKKKLKELPKPLQEIGVTRYENIIGNINLITEGQTDISLIKKFLDLIELDQDTLNIFDKITFVSAQTKSEAVPLALYYLADKRKVAILFDSEKDTLLEEKQKAKQAGITTQDIDSLSKPYDQDLIKIETIEDLVPDHIMVDAINEAGKLFLSEKWINLGNIHRKKLKEPTLGFMAAAKQRLINHNLGKEEIDIVLNKSKKCVFDYVIKNLDESEFSKERAKIAKNFLSNLSKMLQEL